MGLFGKSKKEKELAEILDELGIDLSTPESAVREYIKALESRDSLILSLCVTTKDEMVLAYLSGMFALAEHIEFLNIDIQVLSQNQNNAVVRTIYDLHTKKIGEDQIFQDHVDDVFKLVKRDVRWLVQWDE